LSIANSGSKDTDFGTNLGAEWQDRFWKVWEFLQINLVTIIRKMHKFNYYLETLMVCILLCILQLGILRVRVALQFSNLSLVFIYLFMLHAWHIYNFHGMHPVVLSYSKVYLGSVQIVPQQQSNTTTRNCTYIRYSLCRLIRLLSMWCPVAAFFSASGAALSQEIPTVKWTSNQPALLTPGTQLYIRTSKPTYKQSERDSQTKRV
jgi:hypothetical protein